MALPSGYTELEYIKSSGTQYINTNFIANQDTRILIEFEFDGNAPREHQGIVTARSSASSGMFMFYLISGLNFRSDYNTEIHNFPASELSGRHICDKNKNTCTIDDMTYTAPYATFSTAVPLYLCCENTAGSVQYFAAIRIYTCSIYDNGQLARNYVPCKNPNGEIGLYDQIGAQFYGNAGTGVFEAGPEIIPDYGVVALKAAQLTVSDNAIIALDLHVVDPATGDPLNVTVNSVTGTVNGEAATWQLSGELWVTTVPLSELGQYLCVFDVATSDGKTVEMRLPLYYGVLSLITDRTRADVDELLSILQTPFADWTTEQAQLFYSGMSKGAYNASDLNRVGAAMVYIAERMASMGYAVADIAPKLYWMDTDTVTQSDMSAYLSDVTALQAVLPLPDETPIAPSDMAGLTFTEANDIEQILTIINTMLTNITLAYMYAGELYGGEV